MLKYYTCALCKSRAAGMPWGCLRNNQLKIEIGVFSYFRLVFYHLKKTFLSSDEFFSLRYNFLCSNVLVCFPLSPAHLLAAANKSHIYLHSSTPKGSYFHKKTHIPSNICKNIFVYANKRTDNCKRPSRIFIYLLTNVYNYLNLLWGVVAAICFISLHTFAGK